MKTVMMIAAMFSPVLLASAVFAMDDGAQMETRAAQARTKYGLTGKGVTVAILDRGIDWTNPDFIKPDGTTRIKWLLDMTGQNLCSSSNPQPTEYSETQINAALAGGTRINSRDAVGHGTATAGTAAGNGRGFANGKYSGMAPEADLIIVKLTSEGAPAHDNQTAETPFQGCIDDALTWLDAKATLLAQPIVALINSGTQWGPIDGTSAVSRKIDAVFGLSRPGRIYVAASGDEGNVPNHSAATFSDAATVTIGFSKGDDQTSYLQMWYSGTAPATITINFGDGTTVGPVQPGSSINQSGVQIVQYSPGHEFYPWQSTSSDRAAWLQIVGHKGNGQIQVQSVAPGSGKVDVYADLSSPDRFLYCNVCFLDHLAGGRLTDYSATLSAVAVGDYVLRTTYKDVNGETHDLSNEGLTGQLWYQSSGGPTRDGRPGIALAAPGQNAFASLAQDSYWATLRGNLVQDGGGWYVRVGGTSGSAPMVLGVAALMLQLNPQLTGGDVRRILQQTAQTDSFTGATPNLDWGYGKLDVLAALDNVAGAFSYQFSPGSMTGLSVVTLGQGARPVTGYAPVNSAGNGTLSGIAIFGLRQNGVLVSEAAVPLSTTTQSGRIYAEIGNAVNTGLAIANPNSAPATISFYFTDAAGINITAGSTTIPAHGQIVRFLNEAPFNGSSPLLGTFTFTSTVPVGAVALRGLTNERSDFLITTLPVVPLAASPVTTAVFPHFADGSGWTTEFVLVNPTDSPITGTVSFFDRGSANTSGQPVPLTIDGQTNTVFSYSIPARSAKKMKTAGAEADLKTGSVRVVPDANNTTPAGVAVFSFRNNGIVVSEAGVPAVTASSSVRLYAESSGDSSQIQTGFAIANTAPIPVDAQLQLMTLTGTPAGLTGTVRVPASGQVAMFLNQVEGFTALPPSFQGLLRISTASAAGISVVGLRIRYNERNDVLVTTTAPVDESASSPTSSLVFPHIVDGGGFTTQLILFNAAQDQNTSGSFWTVSQDGTALRILPN
jgi:subtilisin family serine protease